MTQAGYYGNIAFADSQIGRLLSAVGRDTYVIFTSDHGDMLGDHYMYQKCRPYEGSAHIPFMIKGPGIKDSQTIDAPIGWHDIMPTILDLAGLPIPDSVDGRSIVPLIMESRKLDEPWRKYLYLNCVHFHMGAVKARNESKKPNLFDELASQALTDGRMKYIWHVTSGTEQLFDVEHDWNELHDLSQDPAYADELAKWRIVLIKQLEGRAEGYSDGHRLIPGCRVRDWHYCQSLP